MAKPTRLQKQHLGPLVSPFERHNRLHPESKRVMNIGETELFTSAIYDATEDGKPDNVLLTSRDNRSRATKYIWVITSKGIFIAHEETQGHPNRFRTGLCHSNLTGGKKAYQGGELWFLNDDSIVINFYSGRYGAETEEQKRAVVNYFYSVGYDRVIVDEERI